MSSKEGCHVKNGTKLIGRYNDPQHYGYGSCLRQTGSIPTKV